MIARIWITLWRGQRPSLLDVWVGANRFLLVTLLLWLALVFALGLGGGQ